MVANIQKLKSALVNRQTLRDRMFLDVSLYPENTAEKKGNLTLLTQVFSHYNYRSNDILYVLRF